MDRLTRRVERLQTLKTEFVIRRIVHRLPDKALRMSAAERLVTLRGDLRRQSMIDRYGRHHPAVRVLMVRQDVSDAMLDWLEEAAAAERAGEDIDIWIHAHPLPEEARREQ